MVAACGNQSANRLPLSEGERLFRVKCASCHALPKKQDRNWAEVLKEHTKRVRLNEKQIRLLLETLTPAPAN